MKENGLRVSLYAVLAFISFLFLLPIIWMLIVSFKPTAAPTLQVGEWFNFTNLTLENYQHILANTQFTPLKWITNSLVIASTSTMLILLLCGLAAFGFSYYHFSGKNLLLLVIMAGMMIPGEATIIPLYMFMYKIGLINTKAAIILPSMAMPMAFIILKSFFEAVPKDMYEAAKIDGYNSFGMFWTITIPLSVTALSSVGIIAFISVWNDFLWPYLSLYSQDKMTVPVGLMLYTSEFMNERTDPLTAGALLSVPVLVMFILMQKSIVKGIATTGIKG